MIPEYGVDPTDPLPRYYQVYASLQARIRAGEFPPGIALPSERQLVKDYQVSRITIVKAMDLLERDRLINKQQGRGSFVVDQGTSDCEGAPCRIALCMPTFIDSYITAVLVGATRVAMREGAQLQVIGIENAEHETSRVRSAIQAGADGMLLFPRAQFPDLPLYQELHMARYPFVLVDRYYRELDTDWIVFDDEAAGYNLTRFLLSKGHRRIAVFPGDEVRVSSVHRRIRGYRRALEEAGIFYDEDLICLDIYEQLSPASLNHLQSSYTRLAERIQECGFTAMLAVNQIVASQVVIDLMKIKAEQMEAVINGGKQTAMDYLDIDIAAITDKYLIHDHMSLVALAIQSGEVLGERALEVLLQRIRQGSDLPAQHLMVPMEMVELC
jgi:GntR family transcriptional regulator, arabinose operon transcriptional repressor